MPVEVARIDRALPLYLVVSAPHVAKLVDSLLPRDGDEPRMTPLLDPMSSSCVSAAYYRQTRMLTCSYMPSGPSQSKLHRKAGNLTASKSLPYYVGQNLFTNIRFRHILGI